MPRSSAGFVHGTLLEPALEIVRRQMEGEDPKAALRAATILLRIATVSRIQRTASRPPAEPPPRPPSLIDQLEAYINAPLPNEPGHPAYEAHRRRQQAAEDEDSEDDLDEE